MPIGWGRTTPDDVARGLSDKDKRSAFYERMMGRVLFVVLANAQQRTPVRTGTLRRSETTRVEKGGLAGFVGTNVEYAPFVHKRIPFFELAISDSRAAVDKVVAEEGGAYLKAVIE